MKPIIAATIFACLWVTSIMAETLTPQETVRALISSAQKNNLNGVLDTADLVKIATHPRHGQDPRALIAFLRTINPAKLEFEQIKTGPRPQELTVRIVAPISYEFEVVLRNATQERQEDHHVIVAVHP
ncbi:MAG: hypothetical protein WD490_06350 [Opitutales bacterium]